MVPLKNDIEKIKEYYGIEPDYSNIPRLYLNGLRPEPQPEPIIPSVPNPGPKPIVLGPYPIEITKEMLLKQICATIHNKREKLANQKLQQMIQRTK